MPSANKTPLGLNQWQANEYPKMADFNEDNRIIDEKITALQSGSGVKIYTVAELTDPAEGKIYNVKITENTSAINEKPVYKENTSESVTLKAGKVATVYFSGGNFFYKASASGNATSSDVLADKKFSNDDDTDITGTMVNHGAKIFKPSTANIIIPKGYYDGTGYIEGDSDLVASNIVQGKQIFGVNGNALKYEQSEKQSLVDLVNGMGGSVSGNSSFSDIIQVLNSLIVRNNYSERVTCSVIKNTDYTEVSGGGNSTHSYTNGLITQHIKIPPKYAKRGRRFLFTIYRQDLKTYRYDNASTGFVRGSHGVSIIDPRQEIDEKDMPRYFSNKLYFHFVVTGNDAAFAVRREFDVGRPKEEGYPDEQYVLRHLKKSYDVYFM